LTSLLLIEDGVIRRLGTRANSEIPANCRIVDLQDAILAPALLTFTFMVAPA